MEDFERWQQLTAMAHKGPWYRTGLDALSITAAATNPSSEAWGRVLGVAEEMFEAGSDFPGNWLQ